MMVIPLGEPQTARSLSRNGGKMIVICTSASCTHEATIGPLGLIQKGYGDIHLSVIERRLKCVRCGAIKPTVRYSAW